MVPTPSDAFLPLCVCGGLCLCIGPWRQVRITGLVLIGCSGVFFKNTALPVGYVAGDRSVMAFVDGDTFYVSSLKRGTFFTDQWRQHLGMYTDQVKLFVQQDWRWHGYHVVADPFKNPIDVSVCGDKKANKTYLKSVYAHTTDAAIITTSFWSDGLSRKRQYWERQRGGEQSSRRQSTWKKGGQTHQQQDGKENRLSLAPITGQLLEEKGSAYVYADGRIVFERDVINNRPWA